MYDLTNIKKCLEYGNSKNYILFPEVRNEFTIKYVKDNYYGLNELINKADLILKEDSPKITFNMYMSFKKTGDRLKFENAYFKRREQLFVPILAYILTKDVKYLPFIEEKFWEWCDLYSWELPAHFNITENENEIDDDPATAVALFASETAFFFSEIISIIGDKMDKFLVNRIKREIFRRVINPYMSKKYWWESTHMNWASVCAGSVGATSIYLIDDVETLAFIVERVLKTMDIYIDSFDKDGLITEGLTYWYYGFSFYVYFAELLKERTGGKINLLHGNNKIIKIACLPQILLFPSGSFVNFSDSGIGKWNGDSGLFSKLESSLGIHGYNYKNSLNLYNDHTFKWATMIRKLFWTNFKNLMNNTCVKTGCYYFSNSQWLVDRRLTDKEKFVSFSAKGGNNDEPHNHNDLGHFILHYDGEDIFIDIGAPEYVKEYFRNETRYKFLAASSFGHSVPVINGSLQCYGKKFYTKVKEFKEDNPKICFTLNLKNAYSCKELIDYERKFIWNFKELILEIFDNFKFSKNNNEIEEIFITNIKPQSVNDGELLISSSSGLVNLLYDKNIFCDIEKHNYKNHYGIEKNIYRIVFKINTNNLKEFNFKIKIKINEK
ncbi:heparinase [Thermoanaerobacterium thermosaccharolyticum]|uniref:Heparinase n=1 Tax=Thermoanaerobacterium thermosaccharolyticum TaxID=1517 RepID=A0A231VEZ6_THETR|nr:heparinase [Thermoanaerobacterium thermosaccharolyticum]